jgi:hypothetical protein
MDPTNVITEVFARGLTPEDVINLAGVFAAIILTYWLTARARAIVIRMRFKSRAYGPNTILVIDGNNGITEWVISDVHRTHCHAYRIDRPDIMRDIPLAHFLNQPTVTRRPNGAGIHAPPPKEPGQDLMQEPYDGAMPS